MLYQSVRRPGWWHPVPAPLSHCFLLLTLQSIISIMILLTFYGNCITVNVSPIRPIDLMKVQVNNFHMHKTVGQCIHCHCHSRLVLAPDFPQCIEPWAGWTGCVRWRWVWCTKRNCAPPRHQHPPGRGGCSRSRWPARDHWPLVYTTGVWWNVQPTLTLLQTSYLRLFQVQLIFSTSQKYPLPPTMSQNVINWL